MRRFLRIALVWATAIGFAGNGLAGQQCLAAQQPAPASMTVDHVAHSSHSMSHADHGGHHDMAAAEHQHAAGSNNLPASNHDCGKCLCIATGIVQGTEPAELTFAMSSVSFASLAERHPDRPIDPEPGIPKL